jgi:hypothetical protein
VFQDVLMDLLTQHEEAHAATVAALAQLAAAMAAAAASGSGAGAKSAKAQSAAASTIRQLVKQIKALQRQMLSGAGLRSIIKQDVLVELQQDVGCSSGGGGGGSVSGGEEEEEDVTSWALRLLRDDVWRGKAQDAFGQGAK